MPNLTNTVLGQNYNRPIHHNSSYGTRKLQFFQIEIIGYDITQEPDWDISTTDDPTNPEAYRVVYVGDYNSGDHGEEYQESRLSIAYPVLRGIAQIGEIMYNGEFDDGTGPTAGNTYVIVALSMDTVSTNGSDGFNSATSKSLEQAITDSIADFDYDSVNVYPIWHMGNKLED